MVGEHNGRFKETFVGDGGSFPLMSILDTDVVISPSCMKCSEDPGVS